MTAAISHAVEHHVPSVPVRRRFFTPGVIVLMILAAIMFAVAVIRFGFGLESTTNLDQAHPWGIWIAIDVATGVALAAGGFMTAALAHIFHREHYEAITRPALLTAALGYTFVAIGLLFDLGRYYNIWRPLVHWQPNSVLFEVGICVVFYLHVLYIEFLPIVCERLVQTSKYPTLTALARWLNSFLGKVMFFFVIAGVVLSSLHQSSLGNLMVIAPTKWHDLWDTGLSPLLFLMSAAMVGFPMVIFESMLATWSFKLKPEMDILGPLSKYAVFFSGVYIALKLGDLAVRDKLGLMFEGSVASYAFIAEMLLVIVPFCMLLSSRVRSNPAGLFTAAAMIVFGVALNRINVFLIAYNPPYAEKTYAPSIFEIAVTVGLIATLILVYRLAVTFLPVISHPELAAESEKA